MAQSLNEYADVIYMSPSFPENTFNGKYEKKCLLIPMRRCKVLVPYPKENALNLFQKTVLKLLLSGPKEINWLSEALALDEELLEVILDELRTRKLITKAKLVTDIGKNVLSDDASLYDMKTGYVFYNYLTKSYMDAFITDEQLNICNIRNRFGGSNKIQFEPNKSVDNSDYISGTYIKVDLPETKISPSPYDIMGVCNRQRARARMLFPGGYKEAEEYMDLLPRNIELAKSLDSADDVYVATYIAIPIEDLVNKSEVQVCYPFGTGLSNGMLEWIKNAASMVDNAPVKDVLDELKNKQTQLSSNEKAEANKARHDTVERVKNILSNNIVNHPYLFNTAVEVEEYRGRITQLLNVNRGSNWETINAEITNYIVANYSLLAAILIDCSNIYTQYSVANFSRFLGHNAEYLKTIAERCGFTDMNNIFLRYLRVYKKHIREAHVKEELNALIALNLLESDITTDHPFYRLGNRMPEFITEAYEIKRLRSEGMHGNDLEYNFRQVEGLSEFCFKVAACLLNDLMFNSSAMRISEPEMVDEAQQKIRLMARNMVETEFTANIVRYKGLANTLTSLIEEEIREGNSYPSKAAAVLEFLLKELCKHRMDDNATSNLTAGSEAYNQQLTQEMAAFGFDILTAPYYSSYGISKAFSNYRMGTLGTNFYVWYLSEVIQPDCMLAEIGAKCPQLIRVINDTVSTREHKGKMSFQDARLTYIKENLKETINSVVDIMVYRGLY